MIKGLLELTIGTTNFNYDCSFYVRMTDHLSCASAPRLRLARRGPHLPGGAPPPGFRESDLLYNLALLRGPRSTALALGYQRAATSRGPRSKPSRLLPLIPRTPWPSRIWALSSARRMTACGLSTICASPSRSYPGQEEFLGQTKCFDELMMDHRVDLGPIVIDFYTR